jgi:starvation-inducible DNA-binding protein
MEPNIGISAKAREAIIEKLQGVLADTYALYLQTQQAHWNVVGGSFYPLHLLFQKQYEEMAEAVDEIAERIRSLGGMAEGTFSSFLKRTEKKGGGKGNWVKTLLESHEAFCRDWRSLIAFAQKKGDEVTGDLLIKRLTFHEKAAWMLRSHF